MGQELSQHLKAPSWEDAMLIDMIRSMRKDRLKQAGKKSDDVE